MKELSTDDLLETRVKRFLFWNHLNPQYNGSTTGRGTSEKNSSLPVGHVEIKILCTCPTETNLAKKIVIPIQNGENFKGRFSHTFRKAVVDWFNDRSEGPSILQCYSIRWASSSMSH